MVLLSKRNVITSMILAGAVFATPVFAQAQKPFNIVASFSILADMAREIAGDRAIVTALVGPDADAHVYAPTPNDAKALKNADLILINGLGFEGFMPRLIASSGTKARVIIASTGVKPLASGDGHGHDHGRLDPHAWQSVSAAKLYAATIRDGLIAADAANASLYQSRAEAYINALGALDADLKAAFSAIPPEKRIIVTNHDALGYFARDYGFRLESVQGLSTESEPSAKDIARVIRLVREKKARAVFIETFADPRIGAELAKQTGAKLGGTLYSDALSDEKGPAATYISMMRNTMTVLLEALKD